MAKRLTRLLTERILTSCAWLTLNVFGACGGEVRWEREVYSGTALGFRVSMLCGGLKRRTGNGQLSVVDFETRPDILASVETDAGKGGIEYVRRSVSLRTGVSAWGLLQCMLLD